MRERDNIPGDPIGFSGQPDGESLLVKNARAHHGVRRQDAISGEVTTTVFNREDSARSFQSALEGFHPRDQITHVLLNPGDRYVRLEGYELTERTHGKDDGWPHA